MTRAFSRTMSVGALMLVVAAGACGDDDLVAPQANIVETAITAGSFSTLVTAVEAADLAATLSTGGPYTVFAPTDEAFAALPAGTLDQLLQNPDQLREILLYHVVSGEVLAADVISLTSATTLEGTTVAIDATNGVKINDANVIQADVLASNGVIHVIDKVLLP